MSAPIDTLTHVELIWLEKQIEHWIRFGRDVAEQILDRRRRILSFAPGSIFAFVRWAANDFGTVVSRIDILRAVAPGEAYSTLPFVRPGGEILLRISGWPKVERVLQAIDAVEQLGIDPADAASRSLAAHPQPARRRRRSRAPTRASSIAPGSCAEGSTHDALRLGHDDVSSRLLRPRRAALFHPAPKLIWNASASVPIGLYAVHRAGASACHRAGRRHAARAARELPRPSAATCRRACRS